MAVLADPPLTPGQSQFCRPDGSLLPEVQGFLKWLSNDELAQAIRDGRLTDAFELGLEEQFAAYEHRVQAHMPGKHNQKTHTPGYKGPAFEVGNTVDMQYGGSTHTGEVVKVSPITGHPNFVTIKTPDGKTIAGPETLVTPSTKSSAPKMESHPSHTPVPSPQPPTKKQTWWDTPEGQAKKAEFKKKFAKQPAEPKIPDINDDAVDLINQKFGGLAAGGQYGKHPAQYGAVAVGIANKTGTPIGHVIANLDSKAGKNPSDPDSFTSQYTNYLQTEKGAKWASSMNIPTSPGPAKVTSPKGHYNPPKLSPPSTAGGYKSVKSLTNPPPPLTAQQRSSLKNYTGSGYTGINGCLRGTTGCSSAATSHIGHIRNGMRPLPESVVARRGTNFKQFGVTDLKGLQASVGKTVTDKGFVSTTLNDTSGFGSQLAVTFRVPKGTKAHYVKPLSHYPGENELLLDAGLKYRVVHVDPPNPPKYTRAHVIMEVEGE